jgi:hypothetical protein
MGRGGVVKMLVVGFLHRTSFSTVRSDESRRGTRRSTIARHVVNARPLGDW